MQWRTALAGMTALLLAGSCASFEGGGAWPAPSRLGENFVAFRARKAGQARNRDKGFAEPKGNITLARALAAALVNNPRLQAMAWSVRVREAQRIQAALLPNPTLDVTAEGFAGSRQLRGAREMELSVMVSQLIWLGGQRWRRTRLAAMKGREEGWRYEVERLAVLTATAQAFIALLSLQDLIDLTRKEEALLTKVAGLFRERSQAGSIARRDVGRLRVEVRLSRVRLSLERLGGRIHVARRRLASQWGGTRVLFRRAIGRLDAPKDIPDLARLLDAVATSPQVKSWQARLESSRAAIDLARAEAWPDLTITGGLRVLPASGSVGLLVGLSVPLPLFDRNQGNVLAERMRAKAVEQKLREARVLVAARLVRAHQRARAASLTLRRIEEGILPRARDVLAGALDAYREGKAGYLAVLDAQRTVVQLEIEQLMARQDLLQAVTDMEFLLGEPLRNMKKSRIRTEESRERTRR